MYLKYDVVPCPCCKRLPELRITRWFLRRCWFECCGIRPALTHGNSEADIALAAKRWNRQVRATPDYRPSRRPPPLPPSDSNNLHARARAVAVLAEEITRGLEDGQAGATLDPEEAEELRRLTMLLLQSLNEQEQPT